MNGKQIILRVRMCRKDNLEQEVCCPYIHILKIAAKSFVHDENVSKKMLNC